MAGRDAFRELQAACRACRRCAAEGIIPEAGPVFSGDADAPFLLVGQAPGPVEARLGRPFAGRAGRELDRWMARAGFTSDEEFRRLTYITALMRCFPGRNPQGTGDRPPPPRAIRNCASWLDAELVLLRPWLLIPVGQLAIRRFLGPGRLEDRVGRTFGRDPVVIPLPHPSGQSRWLNDPANRRRLVAALAAIGGERRRYLAAGAMAARTQAPGSGPPADRLGGAPAGPHPEVRAPDDDHEQDDRSDDLVGRDRGSDEIGHGVTPPK